MDQNHPLIGHEQNHLKKRKTWLLLPSLLLCLLPYLILTFFISPSGDDYSYAWMGMNSTNFLDTLIGEWHTWNGRYFSNILVLQNPIQYGSFRWYQFIPVLLMFFFIFLHQLAFKKTSDASKIQALIFSLIFLLVYLNVMPDVGEGIYWYTAAVTYFIPTIIIPVYLYFNLQLTKKASFLLFPVLLILQMVLTGFNEIIMILMTAFHLIFPFLNKKNRSTFWILLVTQVIFSAFVCFAPGNAVRGSYFADSHDMIHTLINGTGNTLRFTASLLFTPSLWIYIFIFLKMNLKFRIQKQGFHTLWFWIPLFLTPQFIACAGPVWSTGIIGQHRTPNFALYFQMVIIFLFLVSEKDHKITSTLKRISNHCSYKRLTVAMIVSLSLWGNGYHALADLLSGQASAFKNEDLTRTAALASFGQYQDTTIVIPAYFHTPRSVFIYDISSNPKDWKNEAYTSFYDLKVRGISIRIE